MHSAVVASRSLALVASLVLGGYALARLRFEFRSEVHEAVEPKDAFVGRATAWMTSALREQMWMCWIAENEAVIPSASEGSAPGALIGSLWLYLIPKIPNPNGHPEEHAYLSSFSVRADARNSGIGSLLLAEALSFCETHRIDSIVLWPTERSRPLYLRHGFRVATGMLDRPIAGHF